MITVLFYCTAKPGSEAPLRLLLGEMQRVSREQDRAVAYTFMQQADDPREWALFEQWRDKEHLGAHVANMKKHFGEPPPGARLPARMQALVEKHDHRFYDLVG
jgi:quinol monooxygenase YgiN